MRRQGILEQRRAGTREADHLHHGRLSVGGQGRNVEPGAALHAGVERLGVEFAVARRFVESDIGLVGLVVIAAGLLGGGAQRLDGPEIGRERRRRLDPRIVEKLQGGEAAGGVAASQRRRGDEDLTHRQMQVARREEVGDLLQQPGLAGWFEDAIELQRRCGIEWRDGEHPHGPGQGGGPAAGLLGGDSGPLEPAELAALDIEGAERPGGGSVIVGELRQHGLPLQTGNGCSLRFRGTPGEIVLKDGLEVREGALADRAISALDQQVVPFGGGDQPLVEQGGPGAGDENRIVVLAEPAIVGAGAALHDVEGGERTEMR